MAYIGRTPTNAALTASDLADGIVSTAKIATDAVTDAKIADDVVGTEHLTANEVDTAALGADAVTGAQLADDAVNSEHYTDGSIDTAHIADAQITTAKLATAVLTGATDIGAAIADADLFLVDDGAGGTLRKTAASRLKTYVGSGLSMVDQWRLTSNKTNVSTSDTIIDSNLEQVDTGGQNTVGADMSESSGVFTFPATGIYLVTANVSFAKNADRRAVYVTIEFGSGGTDLASSYGHIKVIASDDTYANVTATTTVNIGNTTNDTVRFAGTAVGGDVTALGSTTKNITTFTFIKLD